MTTAVVIPAVFNAIFLALTPLERWEAMHRLNTNIITDRWFILISLATVATLTALLFVVSFKRTMEERKVTDQLFVKYARKRGLSEREHQILLDIAGKAGLKRSESIFTMGNAFDRGAAKMIEEDLTGRQTSEGSKQQLKTELSFLREKLGFQKQPIPSIGTGAKSKKLSSRQIPVGKTLHITRRNARAGDIESTVIKNNDVELMVKLAIPLESSAGELWRARYYFGTSVWEFDTSVVSCNGNILILNHSDNVRFINRRRFFRVPVNKPAFIGRFPFARTLPAKSGSGKDGSVVVQGSADASGSSWGPPEFVPGIVTELAGPGLRIETGLEVKVGERVLVVFRLDEEEEQDLIAARGDSKSPTLKIVEDIGEVKHTRAIQNGLSIAVELIGLSDSNVNELIRATNAASVRGGAEGRDIAGPVNVEEEVAKPASVQGV